MIDLNGCKAKKRKSGFMSRISGRRSGVGSEEVIYLMTLSAPFGLDINLVKFFGD
jgi:hypothetical protein